MRCPSDPANSRSDNGSNYVGVQGGGPESAASCRWRERVLFLNGLLHHASRVTADHVSDGFSNTLLVGETKYLPRPTHRPEGDRYVGWASSLRSDDATNPNVLAAAVLAINSVPGSGGELTTADWQTGNHQTGPVPDMFFLMSKVFGSFHPGGAMFAYGDGSVKFLDEAMDMAAFRSLGAMNDGGLQ